MARYYRLEPEIARNIPQLMLSTHNIVYICDDSMNKSLVE